MPRDLEVESSREVKVWRCVAQRDVELGFQPNGRQGGNEESERSGSGNGHAHEKTTDPRPSEGDDEDNGEQS